MKRRAGVGAPAWLSHLEVHAAQTDPRHAPSRQRFIAARGGTSSNRSSASFKRSFRYLNGFVGDPIPPGERPPGQLRWYLHGASARTFMSDSDRVWELMKMIGTCMLASWDGQELQARPMAAYVRPEEHAIFLLADARHHKEDDIKRYDKVCLAFSDTGARNYVSVAGNAEVLADRPRSVSCGVFQRRRSGTLRMIRTFAC
jgi:hypothetical protein